MKPPSFVLRKTADGSDTLFSPEMEESYHSLNGAAQESTHVFIEAGLDQIHKQVIHIFEVGFGTGLNALLTWDKARQKGIRINYDAIEAFPVSKEILDSLHYEHYVPDLMPEAFQNIHEAAWNEPAILEPDRFRIQKILGDFTRYDFTQTYDLIYFDAFAPDKQPEMWDESLFGKISQALADEGILVTYCAKGEVRRRMQRSGLRVERLPGPPGKREMIRATKISD